MYNKFRNSRVPVMNVMSFIAAAVKLHAQTSVCANAVQVEHS
jgi:hypothetical protein